MSEHIDLLTGVGAETRSHYCQQMTAHIAPVTGSLPVSALTYRRVAGRVRAITDKGLAPKTIANVHGLLSAAMAKAAPWGASPPAPPD
ncbi:MAG: hypothetical protein HHJ14_10835 [Cellulomonas sp.]|nr:hypothetical protein [Cellulomonas sp.]